MKPGQIHFPAALCVVAASTREPGACTLAIIAPVNPISAARNSPVTTSTMVPPMISKSKGVSPCAARTAPERVAASMVPGNECSFIFEWAILGRENLIVAIRSLHLQGFGLYERFWGPIIELDAAESDYWSLAMVQAKRIAHSPSQEILTRQLLVSVALGQHEADLVLEGATLLNSHSLTWKENWDIVIKGQRIAWVGPHGAWKATTRQKSSVRGLWAVPGFGEAHKHIESTMLSPEYEADLVLRFGTTWNVEASHEFSNVNGARNVEFWLMARAHGSPFKIFPSLGSATPPTGWEESGGYYGYGEIRELNRPQPVGHRPRRGDGLVRGGEPEESGIPAPLGKHRGHAGGPRSGRGPRHRLG